MVTNIPINVNKEPKVKASLQRIGKYLARFDFYSKPDKVIRRKFYGKQTTIIPHSQQMRYLKTTPYDDFIIHIWFYDLVGHKKELGLDYKKATLEVHYDKSGNIVDSYAQF